MVNATASIKNLSIALEAISRVNSKRSAEAFDRIETCLYRAIDSLTEEQISAKRARPAATPLNDDSDYPL